MAETSVSGSYVRAAAASVAGQSCQVTAARLTCDAGSDIAAGRPRVRFPLANRYRRELALLYCSALLGEAVFPLFVAKSENRMVVQLFAPRA
jgi:hypothetical protein